MTYKIVSKYIKDLSFEIAGAKAYFLLEKNIKNLTNSKKRLNHKQKNQLLNSIQNKRKNFLRELR